MAKSSISNQAGRRLQIIESVKTELGFFVLTLLVAEALLATLVVNASGTDRTIAIVGMLGLLFGVGVAVFFLAYRQPPPRSGTAVERAGLNTLDFDRVIAEISSTIDRLERDPDLVAHYRDQGDFSRLMDGLYSALLYASSAVPTGKIEPIFYGNLLEWDEATAALRVRVMGFGKKTDFETGRTLDLDKSYRNIIKPAVEAARLKCVRADEIVHSGLIDVPMYEQLLNADVVVADLSTSNKNAFYELGVSHALRPYTTVVIAEDGIKAFPYDVNHVVVRQYHHLG
jgi:hypothetical protein